MTAVTTLTLLTCVLLVIAVGAVIALCFIPVASQPSRPFGVPTAAVVAVVGVLAAAAVGFAADRATNAAARTELASRYHLRATTSTVRALRGGMLGVGGAAQVTIGGIRHACALVQNNPVVAIPVTLSCDGRTVPPADRGAATATITTWPPSLRDPGRDAVRELARLAVLHEGGALTDAEFAAAKATLLARI